jgi:predicted dinucleotide-binding enzyme
VAFWLNLGSKAEVNELFREWKAAHATIVSVPEERYLGCKQRIRAVVNDKIVIEPSD